MTKEESVDRIEERGLFAGFALIMLFVFSLIGIVSIFIGG